MRLPSPTGVASRPFPFVDPGLDLYDDPVLVGPDREAIDVCERLAVGSGDPQHHMTTLRRVCPSGATSCGNGLRAPLFSATSNEEGAPMATKAIVGEKVGMTQVWDDENRARPRHRLKVTPVPRRPGEDARADGYAAVQVTYGTQKAQRAHQARGRPLRQGRRRPRQAPRRAAARRRRAATRSARRSRSTCFAAGDKVDVTAVSKGKGFAGGMKRHNFKGQGASHGNHKHHRAPGSIGACATPARVFKGTKMAGQHGRRARSPR